jgi:release factor glutamine methyltransferase
MESKVYQVINKAAGVLSEAGVVKAKFEATLLLLWLLNWTKQDLIINSQKNLLEKQINEYEKYIQLRTTGYPLQYITGYQEFMDFKFKVTPDVLIPRYDTEILIDSVLKLDLPENTVAADVGTGSGIIAVTLKKYRPAWKVYAVDISEAALNVAQENAHNLGADVCFLKGDLLIPLEEMEIKPNLIVSNPPYIPEKELTELMKEVQYEPKLALSGGEDGLKFYNKIIPKAYLLLNQGGYIALEIGYNQGCQVCDICKIAGFTNITIQKDYQGYDRVVIARKPRFK